MNQVEGSLQANVRTIATQDDVFQNEVVKTASESATQLIFKDETQLAIGPESEVTLDTFIYDSNPDKGRLVINQTVGTLRFVSGAFFDKMRFVRRPLQSAYAAPHSRSSWQRMERPLSRSKPASLE